MIDPRTLVATLCALLGCTSSTVPPVTCGENGESFEDESGRYCGYLAGSDELECPPELSHAVPVGDGVVCADEPKSLGELPPALCEGFDSVSCGTACGLPAPEWLQGHCAAAIGPLGPPSGPWEIPILDLAGTPIEDGAYVAVRTDPNDRLVVPVTLDLESHVATIGWRCYRVEARVTYADGRVVVGPGLWEDDTVLGQYLSDDEAFPIFVPVDGLGPATLELTTSWHDGQVYVWRREVVIGC